MGGLLPRGRRRLASKGFAHLLPLEADLRLLVPPPIKLTPPFSCYSATHLPSELARPLQLSCSISAGWILAGGPALLGGNFTHAHTQERDEGSEDSTWDTHLKITHATIRESLERTTGRSVCGPTARKGGRETDGWIGASSSSTTLLSSS